LQCSTPSRFSLLAVWCSSARFPLYYSSFNVPAFFAMVRGFLSLLRLSPDDFIIIAYFWRFVNSFWCRRI